MDSILTLFWENFSIVELGDDASLPIEMSKAWSSSYDAYD
tara:strand:- start:2010 stop:2129 length:120 start_codon:yes stop_codon:yes gene_type:complete